MFISTDLNTTFIVDFPGGSDSKASAYNVETWVWSLGQEDPLEKEMATHSSTIAWTIPLMEEPGRLQSMGSQRVGHNWATSLSLCGYTGVADTEEFLQEYTILVQKVVKSCP